MEKSEARFGPVRKQSGQADSDIRAISSYQITTMTDPRDIKAETPTDVYSKPTVEDNPVVDSVVAYFNPKNRLIGIEFFLRGERSGRLFGNRTCSKSSLSISRPATDAIKGMVTYLVPVTGKEKQTPYYLRAVGFLQDNEDNTRQAILGDSAESDLKIIFRPLRGMDVIGIAGQHNVRHILVKYTRDPRLQIN